MSQVMSQKDAKRRVAQHVLKFVEPGMVVGIGSGTTAALFIEELGKRVRDGLAIRGICSSITSEDLAKAQQIPITTFEESLVVDLTIDGADEVSPGLNLIKGGGGNLLREKIVVSASKKFVVIADASKLTQKLGAGFKLPIEVIQMAAPLIIARLRARGIEPEVRRREGKIYITDEGNWILDCQTGPMNDPGALASELRAMVGIVEHGLFLRMATLAVLSDGENIWELDPNASPESFTPPRLPSAER